MHAIFIRSKTKTQSNQEVKSKETVGRIKFFQPETYVSSVKDCIAVEQVGALGTITRNDVRYFIEGIAQYMQSTRAEHYTGDMLINYDSEEYYAFLAFYDKASKVLTIGIQDVSCDGEYFCFKAGQTPIHQVSINIENILMPHGGEWLSDIYETIALKINNYSSAKHIKQLKDKINTMEKANEPISFVYLTTGALMEMYHDEYVKAIRTLNEEEPSKIYDVTRHFKAKWNDNLTVHVKMIYSIINDPNIKDPTLIRRYNPITNIVISLESSNMIKPGFYQETIRPVDTIQHITTVMDLIYRIVYWSTKV